MKNVLYINKYFNTRINKYFNTRINIILAISVVFYIGDLIIKYKKYIKAQLPKVQWQIKLNIKFLN